MTRFNGVLLGFVVAGALAGCMPKPVESDRFLVYFDEFSANITPQAAGVAADAVAKAKAMPAKSIRIEARASATGSPEANQKLAETRAQVVADELQKDGLNPAMFRQQPIGQTGSGDTGVTDRRVDIVLER